MDAMRRVWGAAWLVAAAWLVGCGGGGEGPTEPVPPPAVTPPVITQQPAAQTVAAGGSATFSVTATGNGLAYAWQRSTTGGLSWGAITGATQASYTTGAVDASMNGHQFRVVVQNPAGIVTSDPATLTVPVADSVPTITAQPTDQVAVVPADNDFDNRRAVFTVAVAGSPAPAVRWQVSTDTQGLSFADVPGATGPSFTPPTPTLADQGRRYRAVASNALGTVASRAALLTVTDVGIGGLVTGIALRPNGEVVATITSIAPDFAGVRTATPSRVRTLAGGAGGPHVDASGAAARFSTPAGAVLDGAGNLYLLDGFLAMVVRRVTPGGAVSTLAGNGVAGLVDGVGPLASFNNPKGMTLGADGNLYVADYGNSAIRQVTPAGAVTTFAGGSAGTADGVGRAAQFTNPWGIAADAAGNLWVAEASPSCRIRRIARDATVTTVSDTGCNASLDGPLGTARFFGPSHLAFDGLGNLFVSDQVAVRRIAPDGTVSSPRVFTPIEGVYTNGAIAADATGGFFLIRARSGAVYVERQAPDGARTAFPR